MRSSDVLWTALALKQAGFSYERVASRLGYAGRSGAYKAVQQARGCLGDAVPGLLEELKLVAEAGKAGS